MVNIIKNNTELNKKKIYYFIGLFSVAALRSTVEELQEIIPVDTWWGIIILNITTYGIVAYSVIAPLIFGKDTDLDRVKIERRDLGMRVHELEVENTAVHTTNNMMKQLLDENGITAVKFSYPEEEEKKDTSELDKI